MFDPHSCEGKLFLGVLRFSFRNPGMIRLPCQCHPTFGLQPGFQSGLQRLLPAELSPYPYLTWGPGRCEMGDSSVQYVSGEASISILSRDPPFQEDIDSPGWKQRSVFEKKHGWKEWTGNQRLDSSDEETEMTTTAPRSHNKPRNATTGHMAFGFLGCPANEFSSATPPQKKTQTEPPPPRRTPPKKGPPPSQKKGTQKKTPPKNKKDTPPLIKKRENKTQRTVPFRPQRQARGPWSLPTAWAPST